MLNDLHIAEIFLAARSFVSHSPVVAHVVSSPRIHYAPPLSAKCSQPADPAICRTFNGNCMYPRRDGQAEWLRLYTCERSPLSALTRLEVEYFRWRDRRRHQWTKRLKIRRIIVTESQNNAMFRVNRQYCPIDTVGLPAITIVVTAGFRGLGNLIDILQWKSEDVAK